MKKYLIRTDIEGVSGVVSYDQSVPGRPEYQEGRRLFMGDLLAAIEGLFEGGADEIYLYDEHCAARNICMEELPEKVYAYVGKPPYTLDWAGGIDSSFEGLILLGFHSKAGNEGCLLNHSYESDIRNIDVNGLSLGEIGIEAAIAGEQGVPLLMVTADSEGVREAVELIPDVIGVTVKESLSLYGAMCYPPCTTRQWIRDAARKVAAGAKRPEPFLVDGPVTMKIDFYPGPFAEAFEKKFGQAVYKGNSVLECWVLYQKDKSSLE